MTDHACALRWIVGELRALGVPFQAVGGLAAFAYGARRPLADLDFYVPEARLTDVARAVHPYVVRPPSPYRDEWWDLTFMKLLYGESEIELAGAERARYLGRADRVWRSAEIDFSAAVELPVMGTVIPVMPRAQLIAYKKQLDRQVDRQDIEEIDQSARPHDT